MNTQYQLRATGQGNERNMLLYEGRTGDHGEKSSYRKLLAQLHPLIPNVPVFELMNNFGFTSRDTAVKQLLNMDLDSRYCEIEQTEDKITVTKIY